MQHIANREPVRRTAGRTRPRLRRGCPPLLALGAALAMAGPAWGAGLPTVTTGTPTSITQTSAKLNGKVNPNGEAVSECFFEYGVAPALGTRVPCKTLPGSGTAEVKVAASLSGLAPGIPYDFRLVAAGQGGKSEGEVHTFTTRQPEVPSTETRAATAIAQTTATLNAMVNPNGSEVTDCHFEYGSTIALGEQAPCSSLPGSGTGPIPVSAAVSGLMPNTTYYFQVAATNSVGPSEGETERFTTLDPAPTVETNLASSVTQTTAMLNATVNPNGGEVTDCHFEYGTRLPSGATKPCSTAPGSGTSPVPVSASIEGLAADTTYHFRILATNAGGKGEGGEQEFVTIVTTPPPTAETSAATAITQATATLNATVNPNGGEVTDCHFEYGTRLPSGATKSCSTAPGSGTSPVPVSASIEGLAADTTYHFRILASNAGGSSEGGEQEFTTASAPPPGGGGGETSKAPTSQPQATPPAAAIGVKSSVTVKAPAKGTGWTLAGTVFTLNAAGTTTLGLSCRANTYGGCRDSIALYSSRGALPAAAAKARHGRSTAILLAEAKVTIAPGKTVIVRLHLNAAGRRLAKAHRSFPAKLLLSAHSTTGVTTSRAFSVTLKRAAKRQH
jgi:hypothetical protein